MPGVYCGWRRMNEAAALTILIIVFGLLALLGFLLDSRNAPNQHRDETQQPDM